MSKAENLKKIIEKIDSIILNLKKKKKITDKKLIEDHFWEKHEDLMNDYPFLVCQIIEGADRSMLDYMLRTIDEIDKGKIDQSEADVEIGQKIVDDYIKPQLKDN